MRSSADDDGDPARSTCAIVITFNPDAGLYDRIDRLVGQFPVVFVIDNGSAFDVAGMLRSGLDEGIVKLHANPTNLGIAAALNQGLKLAAQQGCKWAVTFDQDSIALPGLLASLRAVAAASSEADVLVGANYVDIHRNRIAGRARRRRHAPIRRTTLITSGMLLPVAFALRIGGFREDYFIDSVDHEFCLRASDNGAHVLMTPEPLMEHRIGQPGAAGRWWRAFSSNHPPTRKYFIARNTLLTVRQHVGGHPAWAIRQLARLAAESVSILCFESDRKPKLAAFARGLRDGVARQGARAAD